MGSATAVEYEIEVVLESQDTGVCWRLRPCINPTCIRAGMRGQGGEREIFEWVLVKNPRFSSYMNPVFNATWGRRGR